MFIRKFFYGACQFLMQIILDKNIIQKEKYGCIFNIAIYNIFYFFILQMLKKRICSLLYLF